ncbi:MAG: D-alanine--D-alanine ligase [Candidatus Gastranaerophilales bacterium]|nr:D-alanine--D-alanine ligase [Candidatus Gastranaerophilales bacterium]
MEEFCKTLVPLETKIGVLYGGMSSEREVSLRSGKNCYEALIRLGYTNSVLIDVDKDTALKLKEEGIETAFIALHGKYGEDGCIQGLLEILGIPYTGCGVTASAISMNKDITKRVLSLYKDIPLIKSQVVKRDELFDFKLKLRYPLILKPVCEGSSIGMVKVEAPENLDEALLYAYKFSSKVLIEEFIKGLSCTVGVLDIEGETTATPILALRTKKEWYDYESKYTEGLTEFELPAKISDELTERIKEIAVKSHRAVDARGLSRVDFLIDENNGPFVLEINTIPGMTDLSDLPAQAKCMGISYDNLVKIILNSSLIKDK